MALTEQWFWCGPGTAEGEPTESYEEMVKNCVPNIDPKRYEGLAFLNEGEAITTPMTFSHEKYSAKMTEYTQEYPFSPDFIRLITSKELMDKVSSMSVIGGYFDLGKPLYWANVKMTVMLFYRDNCCSTYWYLILDGPFEGSVLESVTRIVLGEFDKGPGPSMTFWNEEVTLCAKSFSEFLYRCHVEDLLYQRSKYQIPLSPYLNQECTWYDQQNKLFGRTIP